MKMRYSARKTLAENLRQLMEQPGMDSQAKVAAKASRPKGEKVGQTTISLLLDPDQPVSPRLQTIEAVADAFGVQAWQLLHPTMGDIGTGQELMARLALVSTRERSAVYQLLAMEPVSDFEVSKHLKPPSKKANTK